MKRAIYYANFSIANNGMQLDDDLTDINYNRLKVNIKNLAKSKIRNGETGYWIIWDNRGHKVLSDKI